MHAEEEDSPGSVPYILSPSGFLLHGSYRFHQRKENRIVVLFQGQGQKALPLAATREAMEVGEDRHREGWSPRSDKQHEIK